MQEAWFDPWVGKIPWRKKWLPTPVFFPRKSHGQGAMGSQESDMTLWLNHHLCARHDFRSWGWKNEGDLLWKLGNKGQHETQYSTVSAVSISSLNVYWAPTMCLAYAGHPGSWVYSRHSLPSGQQSGSHTYPLALSLPWIEGMRMLFPSALV